jgi:hypothetical protein
MGGRDAFNTCLRHSSGSKISATAAALTLAEFGSRQMLLKAVVQNLGQPFAFALLGHGEFACQRRQLIGPIVQLLIGQLEFLDGSDQQRGSFLDDVLQLTIDVPQFFFRVNSRAS